MASSSCASIRPTKTTYDVFISFRGEDNRNTFTGHFYSALCRKKVKAYIDEDRLEKGDEISSALLKAIGESKISVVIFSENYASSSWCLDELAHIVRCKEENKQLVVPIFYHVDPSDIRQQRNNYAVAFAKHEKRFEDEKLHLWRNALTKAGNMSGYDIPVSRSESKVVEEIVEDILVKLDNMLSKDDFKYLVGIEKHVQKFEQLLYFGLLDVRIIGIWGMGGIGKTTLAEVIFRRFARRFESCCFLNNVKSKAQKLDKLQKKLFSELLEEKIKNVNPFLMNRLQRMKVLVVLDDVDDVEQLEYLARDRSWFGQGSRIIITTRNKQVLNNIEADEMYEVDELNSCEALQLFYTNAFRGNSPSPVYAEMSSVVVEYAKGVPLVLKVLGCHLYSKSEEEWESELKKMRKIIPCDKVQKVLQISYEGLSYDEKNIFLDITFFINWKLDHAKRILDSYHVGVAAGIRVLIDKSLITIDHSNALSMHDLLLEMGVEIVRQESPNEPGMRSRLWFTEDVCNVLKNNAGTPKIHGMSMDMFGISSAICLSPRVFEAMHNLKFLNFFGYCIEGKLHLPKKGLKCLPRELRYLRWDSFPLKSLPPKLWPQNLIQLHLRNSKVEKLWDGVQHIVSLKFLNLEGSKKLTEIPDLACALNLVRINLGGCTCLKQLPSSIGKLESLKILTLSHCSNIDEFPELPNNITQLYMAATAIEDVPPSIERLSRLLVFNLRNCKRLKSLPANFFKLKSLRELFLGGCSALKHWPEIKEPVEGEHITVLETQEPVIRLLPLPDEKLDGITKFVLQDTSVSEIPDWLFCLPALNTLNLSETNTIRIPESIKLSKLRYLFIRECRFLQSLPELPFSVEVVDAAGCVSLETVSNSWSLLAQGPKWNLPPRMVFSFEGCLKLDHKNIITEFQLRALSYASIFAPLKQMYLIFEDWLMFNYKAIRTPHLTASFSSLMPEVPRIEQERYVVPHDVVVSYPGDEIPEWFNYQNEGDSINIKLPMEYTDFIGLAFCFVLENAHNNIPGEATCLNWEIHVKANSNVESHFQFLSRSNYYGGSYDLNHVLMTAVLRTIDFDFYAVKETSFHFSFEDLLKRKIKRCGIRMLSLEDAIEFGIISDQYVFGESNVITNELQQSGIWKEMLYPLLKFHVFPSRRQLCEEILSCNLPKRHQELWLLLVSDFFPVREVVNRRMDVADTSCPLCGLVPESATHLFLYCKTVRPLWFMSRWSLRTDSLVSNSMASFLELVLFVDPHSELSSFAEEFLLYASLLVETIWLARNELVHEGKVFHTANIHSSVEVQFNNIILLKQYPSRNLFDQLQSFFCSAGNTIQSQTKIEG